MAPSVLRMPSTKMTSAPSYTGHCTTALPVSGDGGGDACGELDDVAETRSGDGSSSSEGGARKLRQPLHASCGASTGSDLMLCCTWARSMVILFLMKDSMRATSSVG